MIPNYIPTNTIIDSLSPVITAAVENNRTDGTLVTSSSYNSDQSSVVIGSNNSSDTTAAISNSADDEHSDEQTVPKCSDVEMASATNDQQITRTVTVMQGHGSISNVANQSIENLVARNKDLEDVAVDEHSEGDVSDSTMWPITLNRPCDVAVPSPVIQTGSKSPTKIDNSSTVTTLTITGTSSSTFTTSVAAIDTTFESVQHNTVCDEQPTISGDRIITTKESEQKSKPSAKLSKVNVDGRSSANDSSSRNQIRVKNVYKMRSKTKRKPKIKRKTSRGIKQLPKAQTQPPSNRVAGMPDPDANMAPLPSSPIARLIATAGGLIDRRTNKAYMPIKNGSYRGMSLESFPLQSIMPLNNVSENLKIVPKTSTINSSPSNSITLGMQMPQIQPTLTGSSDQQPTTVTSSSDRKVALTNLVYKPVTTMSIDIDENQRQQTIPPAVQIPLPPRLLPLPPPSSVRITATTPQPIIATDTTYNNGLSTDDNTIPTTTIPSIDNTQINLNAGPMSDLIYQEITAVKFHMRLYVCARNLSAFPFFPAHLL